MTAVLRSAFWHFSAMRWPWLFAFVCVLVTGVFSHSWHRNSAKDVPATSGKCGDNMSWSYNTTSFTLTISGSGHMYDYTECGPWSSFDDKMTRIIISDGIESIGNYAFASCNKVENVTMGDTVKTLGSHSFYVMSALTSIKLSQLLETIGSHAFSAASSLESIELPNSLLHIEQYAFHDSALTSVSIPASVSFISETSFRACTNITSFSVNQANAYFSSRNDVLFNENGTIIYFYPPSKNRTNFTIPANVTKICSCAFFRTKHLVNINVDQGNVYYSSQDGVLFDKNFMTLIRYPNKKTNQTYSVPGTVKTIVDSAFFSCSSLESITLQEGLTTIEQSAFCYCSKLETLSLPGSVAALGGGVVYGCNSLKSISANKNNTMYKSEDGVLFSKDGKLLVHNIRKENQVVNTQFHME